MDLDYTTISSPWWCDGAQTTQRFDAWKQGWPHRFLRPEYNEVFSHLLCNSCLSTSLIGTNIYINHDVCTYIAVKTSSERVASNYVLAHITRLHTRVQEDSPFCQLTAENSIHVVLEQCPWRQAMLPGVSNASEEPDKTQQHYQGGKNNVQS